MINVPRTNVLGVGISAIHMTMALDIIENWITRGEHHYVAVTGVHGVMESQRSPDVRKAINQAGLVTPDGMPMVWLSRLNGHSEVGRVYGPDLMLELCRRSIDQGYRHFLYGGGPQVATLLEKKLDQRFPGLQVVGTYSPPFRPLTADEDNDLIETINTSQAHIVWVGLSTPKQEEWMAAHVNRLNANVLIGVGAAFDFHAGLKKQAPYWMQRSGLEWFYRMVMEPRRLLKRYLINNPLFIGLVLLQICGLKHYSLEIEEG